MDKPEPETARTAAPLQPTSPLPEGLRTMQKARDKSLPMDQDPMMKSAFDRFRRLSENLKPTPPVAPKPPANLSFSHLSPDVQARVLARSEVARKAKAEYWAYVAEQDAKDVSGMTPKDSAS